MHAYYCCLTVFVISISVGDSRIRPVENVLYLDDIDYEDRKKHTYVGTVGNETVKQTFTLRVQGEYRVRSRVAGWDLAPPIVFSLLVFFLCN